MRSYDEQDAGAKQTFNFELLHELSLRFTALPKTSRRIKPSGTSLILTLCIQESPLARRDRIYAAHAAKRCKPCQSWRVCVA